MRLLRIIVVLLPTICLVQGVGYRYRADPRTGEKLLVLHVPGSDPSIQTEFDDKKVTPGAKSPDTNRPNRRVQESSPKPSKDASSPLNKVNDNTNYEKEFLAGYTRPNPNPSRRPLPSTPPPPPPRPPHRAPPPFTDDNGYTYKRPKNPLQLPGEGGNGGVSTTRRPVAPPPPPRPPVSYPDVPAEENFGIGQNSEENKDLRGKRPGHRPSPFPTRPRVPERPSRPTPETRPVAPLPPDRPFRPVRPPVRPGPPPPERPFRPERPPRPSRPEFGPEREAEEFPSRRPGGNEGSFGLPGDNSIGSGGSRDRDFGSGSRDRNQGEQSFSNQGSRGEAGQRFRPSDRNRPGPPGDRRPESGPPGTTQSNREQGTRFNQEDRQTQSEKRFEEREKEFHSGNRFNQRERDRESQGGNRFDQREREREEERRKTVVSQQENRFNQQDSREEERRRVTSSSSGNRGSGGDRNIRPVGPPGPPGPPRRPPPTDFFGNEIDTEERRVVTESKKESSSMSSFNSQESFKFSSSSQGNRRGSGSNAGTASAGGDGQTNDKDIRECGQNGDYERFSHRLGKCVKIG